jgi:hypothetical protein
MNWVPVALAIAAPICAICSVLASRRSDDRAGYWDEDCACCQADCGEVGPDGTTCLICNH